MSPVILGAMTTTSHSLLHHMIRWLHLKPQLVGDWGGHEKVNVTLGSRRLIFTQNQPINKAISI